MAVASPQAPKPVPDEALAAQLADGRALTISEICAESGLSRSTVVLALARLRKAGSVREHSPESTSRGRPARRWSIPAAPKMMAVVVPAAHGTVAGVADAQGEIRSWVVADDSGSSTMTRDQAVLGLVDEALLRAGLTADDVGLGVIGLPGPSQFPATGRPELAELSHLDRFRDWDGQPPSAVLARHLDCPVFSENDANLAALGEALYGAGAGLDAVLFIGLVHGTGSGLVLNGRVHRGRSHLAGEVGHLHVSDDGRLCECGARGCFWQTLSIPALLEELSAVRGRKVTIEDVSEGVARDELDVVRALRGFGEALGRRLADAVVFLDPDVIVLDAALRNAADVVAEGVRVAVRRCAPPAMVRGLPIVPGQLGNHAHIHGALGLARTEMLWSTSPAAP